MNNDKLFEHAWKYFEIHSQQRVNVINFFLAISGIVGAGIGLSLQQGGGFNYSAGMLSLFLSFLSFIFWKLDERVSEMIKNSEEALACLEKQFEKSEAKLFTNDRINTSSRKGLLSTWTYGRCFRCAFYVVGYAGFLIAIFSFSLIIMK